MSEKHANFIVNDQKGTAADVRRLAERVRAEVARPRRRSTLAFEIVFLGDWAGWRGRRREPTPDATARPADRRPARRPVGRARRLDRVRDRDRRRPWPTPGYAVEPGPDRPRRRLVVAARRPSARRPAGRRLRRPGARSAPTGPLDGRRRARPARRGATRRRSCSSPSTARSARTAPSRRCSRRPAWPTPGRAWRRRRSGMDKALFKRLVPRARPAGRRLARGPRGALGGATRDARPRRARGVRRRAPATPRLMVKPARLGASVGMTLAHDAGRARRPRSTTAFRYDTLALVEALPRRRPRPRGRGHRQRPGAARAVRPGRDRRRPRVLRLRREVHAGLSETSTRAEVTDAERATMLKIARDAYRAIGAEGFARVDFLRRRRRRSTCPRSTRSRASPRSACSRRCRPRAATLRRRLRPGRRPRARAPRRAGPAGA